MMVDGQDYTNAYMDIGDCSDAKLKDEAKVIFKNNKILIMFKFTIIDILDQVSIFY